MDDSQAVAWTNTRPTEEIDPSSIVEKEAVIKEILNIQEGLRALLERVEEVDVECDKMKGSNEILQTYIDNLTRNNVRSAGR